jgi:hypothetical protein
LAEVLEILLHHFGLSGLPVSMSSV